MQTQTIKRKSKSFLGDTLYISSTTAGGLVNTPPTGESNFIQNIGKVLKVHASAGIIKVGGAGRSNATPNLNQDKIFLGNASNQAVSTALSSVNLSSFNNNLDTDDISEGVTNLYYTNARFDTQLGTKTTDNLTEGVTNLYYTNARFDTQLGTKDTGDLSEGVNLYYTNARADARIAAADMTDLNDVNYTAGAGIDGKFLKYVNANNRWEAADAPAGAVSSVNTQTGAVVLDTDDISEGTSNLYYTNARFDTQLGTKTTDNLTEGVSNLYYTNARFDTQLGTKTTDNLTEGASNLYYTNARFDTQLGTKDTGDLSEGANLYYTNARADARIAAANLTDLNDVNYTAGAGIDGYVLTYSNTNTRWEAQAASGGGGGFSYTAITSASSPVTSAISTHYGADSSGGAITFNLPALSGLSGGEEIRIKLNTAGNNLTITPNGSDTIEGASTYVMSIAKEAVTCVASSGTNWEVI
jgi:hypothetical protein